MGFPLGSDESILANPLWVMYKGVYDFEKVYKSIMAWYEAHMFEFHETGFKNKADNIGDELELKLMGKKKVDAIAQYQIFVHLHNSDTDIIEVEDKNGSKKRMYKGRIRIDISAKLTIDYQKNFDQNKFTRKLGKFVFDKVLDQVVDFDYADDLWYLAHALQSLIKDGLNMDTVGNNY
ncbi:hypothetical protein JXM83_03380 [Candidatus Woesearchaeota archaeon]|nr:hypothetical protein [Candidatus Woesearchaeota archaeon]